MTFGAGARGGKVCRFYSRAPRRLSPGGLARPLIGGAGAVTAEHGAGAPAGLFSLLNGRNIVMADKVVDTDDEMTVEEPSLTR